MHVAALDLRSKYVSLVLFVKPRKKLSVSKNSNYSFDFIMIDMFSLAMYLIMFTERHDTPLYTPGRV